MKLLIGCLTFCFGFIYFGDNEEHSKSNLPYEILWSQVDSLKAKGLPKSALEIVEIIYDKAKKEGNLGNQVKSVFFLSEFKTQTEEEGEYGFYYWLQEEINNSDELFAAILHSLSGETLENIYSYSVYKLSNKTTIEDVVDSDLSTWSKETFKDKIASHYLKSIKSENILNENVQLLDSVIAEYSKDALIYTPTVYDLLVQRVLKYFSKNATGLVKSQNHFRIEDENFFLPGKQFMRFPISTEDSLSNEFQIISLYQKYLLNISNRDLPQLFASIDLDRLLYINSNYEGKDKDANFEKVLNQLSTVYVDTISTQRILTSRASILIKDGNKYNRNDKESFQFRWKKKEAFDLLNNFLISNPDIEIIYDFRQVYDQLSAHFLEVNIEKVILPENPVLVGINFKNIDSLHFYLKSISPENYFTPNSRRNFLDENKLEEFINTSSKVLSLPIPNSGDLQTHSTEYFLKGLQSGKYEVLVIGKNNLSKNSKDLFAYSTFNVSNIAILSKQYSNEEVNNYKVVDRNSGKTLNGVEIKVYAENYDSKGRSMDLIETIFTNESGEFALGKVENKNLEIVARNNSDILHESLGYSYYRNDYNKVNEVKFGSIFTDRAIYRPGQTLFFKAILYSKSTNTEKYPQLLPNSKVELILRDANGKEINRKKFSSDQYGSINGMFNLPQGGLTGSFTLQLSDGFQGAQNIQVEEYKRPKFSVAFEDNEEAIKLGEEINITALAKYFSGVSAEGAEYTFRIIRRTIVPYWYRYYPTWIEQDESIIGEGKGLVNKDGEIDIKFSAKPKHSLELQPKQFYNFEIIVDVVDINGETRSNTLILPVSSIDKFINVDVKDLIFQKEIENNKVKITSLNILQKPVSAGIELKVEKLKVPNDDFINRYWEEPDTNILSRSEFKNLFPLFSYNNEFNKENLAVEKSLLKKVYSVNGEIEIDIKDLGIKSPGIYKISIQIPESDFNEKPIETFLEIAADKNPDKFGSDVTFYTEMDTAQPGETVNISIVSPFLINGQLSVNRTGNRYETCGLDLNGVHNFTIEVDENDRGGIQVQFSGIKFNRAFSASRMIEVPWDNRKLIVSVDHFRNVAEPGAEEEYTLNIKNLKGEPVNGQILASMYDASLDQFLPHHWNFDFSPGLNVRYDFSPLSFNSVGLYGRNLSQVSFLKNSQFDYRKELNFKYSINFNQIYPMYRNAPTLSNAVIAEYKVPLIEQDNTESRGKLALESGDFSDENAMSNQSDDTKVEVTVRENLNELVFFYPDLEVKDGKAKLNYTNNEALTEWKLQILAIDKDLSIGHYQNTVKTQKDLMVFPNWPRFLRQGDTIIFETRVNNLSDKDVNTTVVLESNDVISGMAVQGILESQDESKQVSINAGGYALVKWKLFVPKNQIKPLEFIVKAIGEEQSDAERMVLPVLTNRILITDALHMSLKAGEEQNFTFTRFQNQFGSQNSIENLNYTLEYTANPAWYAVQALPYLEEQQFNSTTAIFHKLYANALAKSIVDKKPQIKKVFDQWILEGSDALLSNLSKNEELKNILLEETPWVMNAQSETEQKLNIARLFEFNRMSHELQQSLDKLKQKQKPDGGFPWFEEPRSNWYISQSLLSGLVHLHQLGAINIQSPEYQMMVKKLVAYLDMMVVERYNHIKKEVEKKNTTWDKMHLSSIIVHYLYTRNAYSSLVKDGFNTEEYTYFSKQTRKHWLKMSLFDQALIAIATVYKSGKEDALVKDILKSLKEKAFQDEELGIYWAKLSGFYWNQSALSLQALMIELFVLCDDETLVDEAINWLIKNKQTNRWKNSASTVEAIYALLFSGVDVLDSTNPPTITVGEEIIDTKSNAEAGTGYIKQKWDAGEIKKELGDVKIKNNNNTIAWGAVYWQYFEDIDKVEASADGPLKLERKLYKKVSTATGSKLIELKDGELAKGDEVVVRLTIEVDRPMEFVHIKDQRAAAFEPIDVLSAYKYSGGLGYYHVTKDVSTNFFVSMLNRGTYVLEYSVRVFQDGNYSTGMTTIESMYAPEFKSHSEGRRYSSKD